MAQRAFKPFHGILFYIYLFALSQFAIEIVAAQPFVNNWPGQPTAPPSFAPWPGSSGGPSPSGQPGFFAPAFPPPVWIPPPGQQPGLPPEYVYTQQQLPPQQTTGMQPAWNQPVQNTQNTGQALTGPARSRPSIYHPEMIPMRKDSTFKFSASPSAEESASFNGRSASSLIPGNSSDTPEARYQAMLRQIQEEKRRQVISAPASLPQREEAFVAQQQISTDMGQQQIASISSDHEVSFANVAMTSQEPATAAHQVAQAPQQQENRSDVRQLQEQVRQLETERDGLRAFVQTLMARVEKAQQIEAEWSKLTKERDQLREMFHAIEQEVDEARKAQHRVGELEAERDRMQASLQQLEAQLAQSNGAQDKARQLEVEREKMHAILGNIQESEIETQALRTRVADLEIERDRLKSALDQRAQMEVGTVSLAVQEKMHQLETENKELKATVERLTVRVQTLTQGDAGGQELADLDAAIHATDLGLEQARQIERSETALREAQETARQVRAAMLRAQEAQAELSEKERTVIQQASQSVVQKVVIQGAGSMAAFDSQGNDTANVQQDAVVVTLPQLPPNAIASIRQSASELIGKIFTVDEARLLGQRIGGALQQFGLTQYDVVLPKQDLTRGVILVEVRPGI